MTFEVILRRLEMGKQSPPRGTIEGHPELVAQFFNLKKVQENLHRRH